MNSNRISKFLKGLWFAVAILLYAVALLIAYERFEMRRQIALIAVKMANDSGLFRKRLGAPIKQGHFVSGRIIGGMDGGTADLVIPVSGPSGNGILVDWSQNSFAGWHVCSLIFHQKYGSDVVIAPDENAQCERE